MNIFALDINPSIAAKYHCNKHVVKMIVETVQLLSTANRLNGIDKGYKATHNNHPCSVWIRSSKENYEWACDLLKHLHSEWLYRFDHSPNKVHKSYNVAIADNLFDSSFLPSNSLTPFLTVMPEEYIINSSKDKMENAIMSYRNYYANAKESMHNWGKQSTPHWLESFRSNV